MYCFTSKCLCFVPFSFRVHSTLQIHTVEYDYLITLLSSTMEKVQKKKDVNIFDGTMLLSLLYSTVFVSFTGNKPVLFLPVLLICTSVSTSSPPFTITPLIYPISCA